MRPLTLILAVLLLLLQYPLWLGKGGWLKVWDLNRQVELQAQVNQQNQARNALLDAEVRDLKQGTEALEERARSELGMIKRGETFFQVLEKPPGEAAEQQGILPPASPAPGVQ
jgi:cell division protein FtsB